MGKAKAKKELQRRYGNIAKNMSEYHHHLDFRFFEDFEDEAFFFVMQNVKGINMLDLNETQITDKSIKLLSKLEYINELRAKECLNLTNFCTEDLNKLTDLTFLHLKNTAITIDGLLKLENLSNLRTLLFSADEPLLIKEKLIQLKVLLPLCEMVINSKPYQFNAVDLFVKFLSDKPYLYRFKIKNRSLDESWNSTITKPIEHYLETDIQGKIPLEEIEWVEIKPQNQFFDKNLNDNESLNFFSDLIAFLVILEFPYVLKDGILSTYILENEI